MKLNAHLTTIAALSGLIASPLLAQGPPPGGGRKHTETKSKTLELIPANRSTKDKNKVDIRIEGDFRIITANSIPEHKVGKFPNSGNPNTISEQKVELKLPLKPTSNDKTEPARTAVGISINGVYMEAGTGEFWTGEGQAWNYEALGGAINLGLDENHAHVQPGGKYHYHGLPAGLLKELNVTKTKHSPIIGWAFDGFPIYALYGYKDPNDTSSEIVEQTSSYQLKKGTRPKAPDGPSGNYDGAFTADYEYVDGHGTLDECNGRFTITPEFPEGTYAYFLSNEWPVIFRLYRGTPAMKSPRSQGQGGPDRSGRGPRGQRPQGPPPHSHEHSEEPHQH